MRGWRIAWLAGAALAASACGMAQSPTAPAAEKRAPSDGRLMPPERVADHVWVMRQPDRLWAAVIGNVAIVEQSDGVVLIDSGGSIADGRDIVRAVARLTPKPIKAVALTHWHNDHPLGVPGILETFPRARIISTPVTAQFIRTETNVGMGKSDPALDAKRRATASQTIAEFNAAAAKSASPAGMRAQFATEAKWVAQRVERQMGNYAVAPTETFAETLLIDDPVAPVELRFLGIANTQGDIIAWLPRQRVVATGDMVVLPTPYGFTVSVAPWLETLSRLEALPFTALIPGHGKVQHDREYLATLAWSMRDIAARAKAAAASGQPRDKALAAFDRSAQQQRFGATDAWTREWLNAYWLDGMFGTAFDEARGIPAPGK
jgi:glyoxylase-like metal-dependent hydrolase (beta-lactamase superfamily II)